MPDYIPIPTSDARSIADKYQKHQVIIVTWDNVHQKLHTVSYGVNPEDKLYAARLCEIVAKAAGCVPDEKNVVEDFRLVPIAQYKAKVDRLEKVNDMLMATVKEIHRTMTSPSRELLDSTRREIEPWLPMIEAVIAEAERKSS